MNFKAFLTFKRNPFSSEIFGSFGKLRLFFSISLIENFPVFKTTKMMDSYKKIMRVTIWKISFHLFNIAQQHSNDLCNKIIQFEKYQNCFRVGNSLFEHSRFFFLFRKKKKWNKKETLNNEFLRNSNLFCHLSFSTSKRFLLTPDIGSITYCTTKIEENFFLENSDVWNRLISRRLIKQSFKFLVQFVWLTFCEISLEIRCLKPSQLFCETWSCCMV